MQEEIQKLEEKIKNLHYNPIYQRADFSEDELKELLTNFWEYHIKYVIEKSKEMAKKYHGHFEAIWLAAILHDIARLENIEPHDEIGSEKAYKMLLEKGYDKELAQEVKNIILTHRCKKYPPETLEQKILATADAVSHFLTPFYIWVAKDFKYSMENLLEENLVKINRDYNEKIFFEDEKNEVKKYFEVMKNWCEYKKLLGTNIEEY